LKLLLSELRWRDEAVAFDQPGGVVGFLEVQELWGKLGDGMKKAA
jgi:hypothetical protein